MESSGTRKLNVKTVSGEVKTFEVASDILISQLKEVIGGVFRIPSDRQRLIYHGKLLKDDKPLSEWIKEDGMTIHMMARADDVPSQPPQGQQPVPEPNVRIIPGIQIPNIPNAGFINQMMSNLMGNIGNMIGPAPNSQPQQVHIQIPLVPQHGHHPHPHQPHAHPNEAPRQPAEISLPFPNVQNIGHIVNQLHGPGSGFPPPRMPQLNVERNAIVLLGGFLYNYQFQMLRLLPFISRLADLLQRESLITDPNERMHLNHLSRSVGAALNELQLATTPAIELLNNLSIGPAPGQYQLRANGANIVSEHQIRQDQQPAQPQHPARPQQPAQLAAMQGQINIITGQIPNLGQNPNIMAGLSSMMAGMPNMMAGQNPQQGMPAQMQNIMQQLGPMFGEMFGGSSTMTLRELVHSMNMVEDDENLPMMDFFYSLTIPDVMAIAQGNWSAIERIRPRVREGLLNRMENDSPENRAALVQEVSAYLSSFYNVPAQFQNRLQPGFDPRQQITDISTFWVSRGLDLAIDYQGTDFANELKNIISLMIGNYVDTMSEGIIGGVPAVLELFQFIMTASINTHMPDMGGMILGMAGPIINGYFNSCLQRYLQWKEMMRTQQEANQGQQTPAAALLNAWNSIISQDTARQSNNQRPLSRSYLSSDLFINQPSLPGVQDLFFRSLTEAASSVGARPNNDLVPPEVTQTFVRDLRDSIRGRVSQDSDYRHGRFEGLDRHHK